MKKLGDVRSTAIAASWPIGASSSGFPRYPNHPSTIVTQVRSRPCVQNGRAYFIDRRYLRHLWCGGANAVRISCENSGLADDGSRGRGRSCDADLSQRHRDSPRRLGCGEHDQTPTVGTGERYSSRFLRQLIRELPANAAIGEMEFGRPCRCRWRMASLRRLDSLADDPARPRASCRSSRRICSKPMRHSATAKMVGGGAMSRRRGASCAARRQGCEPRNARRRSAMSHLASSDVRRRAASSLARDRELATTRYF